MTRPAIVAISAIATNNSGYMFIGMIGFTYVYGLMSIWLMVGWVLGDFLISLVVHRHLREVSQKSDVYSYSGVLSDWYGRPFRSLRIIGGFITLIFLCTYAAAQLKVGGKVLHALFGYHESVGVILGGGIVLVYCSVGGIRASFWTDVAQSIVMIAGMGSLLLAGIIAAGGSVEAYRTLDAVSPNYMSLFTHDLPLGPYFGPLLFVSGWLFAGFSVAGQPHIMVRFMSLDSVKNLTRVRIYYYTWYVAFYIITIGVGLLSRILLKEGSAFDPEIALPMLSVQLLPGFFAGVVLAAVFAATMSTADSQILVCTASVTGDFTKNHCDNYLFTKLATAALTLTIVAIAVAADESVFTLVVFSWGALGSAFVPLISLYSLGKKISEPLSVAIVLAGLATALLFRFFFGWTMVYEALPGILAGFIPYFIHKRTGSSPNR